MQPSVRVIDADGCKVTTGQY